MTYQITVDKEKSRQERYEQLLPQIASLIKGERNLIANLANTAAALKDSFGFLWVGFYLMEDTELVLGPFQGPIACNRIKSGQGVCGRAVEQAQTIIVDNVHEFEGHIACSAETNSEIVVPLIRSGKVIAVLDADSDQFQDFDETDKSYLEKIVELLIEQLD